MGILTSVKYANENNNVIYFMCDEKTNLINRRKNFTLMVLSL
jgi:hypothetical protein